MAADENKTEVPRSQDGAYGGTQTNDRQDLRDAAAQQFGKRD